MANTQPVITPSDRLLGGWAVSAPAKINRFLHITGRRDDGYHLLETGFQFVEWADCIHLRISANPGIHILDDPLNLGDDNLVYRAAVALSLPPTTGLEILIEKNLPNGAGLGGGSSDAASVLVALNHLLALNHSTETLCEIGLTLGADVPVFIYGRSCFASGVGEHFEREDWGGHQVLIATPSIAISTGAIFNHPKLTRNSPSCRIRASQLDTTNNDCERAVIEAYPAIRELMDAFGDLGQPRLTGTGSSVFVIDPNLKATHALESVQRLAKVKVALLSSHSMLYTCGDFA